MTIAHETLNQVDSESKGCIKSHLLTVTDWQAELLVPPQPQLKELEQSSSCPPGNGTSVREGESPPEKVICHNFQLLSVSTFH